MNTKNYKKGTYKHFKGGMYTLISVAKNSETLEDMIIYQSNETGILWRRPAEMWDEEVEFENKKVKRFTFVKE